MTLYGVLGILDELFTPNSTLFSDYVKCTSDYNGGFLRTCYCKKSKIQGDRRISDDLNCVVLGMSMPFDKDKLITYHAKTPFEFEATLTKMQVCFTVKEDVDDEVEWNQELGYSYCYIIDLNSKEIEERFN